MATLFSSMIRLSSNQQLNMNKCSHKYNYEINNNKNILYITVKKNLQHSIVI